MSDIFQRSKTTIETLSTQKKEDICVSTNLMEGEALRADPRMLGVVLAVMEDLAVEVLVGVVAGLLVDAIESTLG